MATKKIELSVEQAKVIYKTAPESVKQILEINFSKAELLPDIIDSVSSFEDIMRELRDNEVAPCLNPVNKYQKLTNAVWRIEKAAAFFNKNTKKESYLYFPYSGLYGVSRRLFVGFWYFRVFCPAGLAFYNEEHLKHTFKIMKSDWEDFFMTKFDN